MLENIIFTGGIGSLIFTCFLLFFDLSGWVRYIRDEEGRFQNKWNWKAMSGVLLFIALLLGILIWGNFRLAEALSVHPTSAELFLNAFGIFFFMHLYDLIVIDYLLIVKWHPKFLNLPETEYYKSIKPHIKGFLRGIPLGIIASIASGYVFSLFT